MRRAELEVQSQSELHLSRRVVRRGARSASGQISLCAVGRVGVIESLVVKEIEDIHVESQIESLRDGKDFKERHIRVPVPWAMDKGLPVGIGSKGAGSEGLRFAASFQAAAGHDYVVGVVVAGSGYGVDRLLVWSVAAWKSKDAFGRALAGGGVGRRGDVSVEPRIFGIADTAAAVRDGHLVFEEVDRAGRSPVRTGDREDLVQDISISGNLVAADQFIDEPV